MSLNYSGLFVCVFMIMGYYYYYYYLIKKQQGNEIGNNPVYYIFNPAIKLISPAGLGQINSILK